MKAILSILILVTMIQVHAAPGVKCPKKIPKILCDSNNHMYKLTCINKSQGAIMEFYDWPGARWGFQLRVVLKSQTDGTWTSNDKSYSMTHLSDRPFTVQLVTTRTDDISNRILKPNKDETVTWGCFLK